MLGTIRVLLQVANVLNAGIQFYKEWKMREEARADVANEINAKQKAILDETKRIMDEPSSPDDTDKRLRDGKF